MSFKPRFKYREVVTVDYNKRQRVPSCRRSAAEGSFADASPSEGHIEKQPPPLFHPNFGDVPLGLHYRCCGFTRSEDPKLIICVITFELVPNTYAHGTATSRTDRQTDGRLTVAIPRSALCGKILKRRKSSEPYDMKA